MRLIAHAYVARKVSDRALILDSLWLVFLSTYTMWLVIGGLKWLAVGVGAFIVYKLVLVIATLTT